MADVTRTGTVHTVANGPPLGVYGAEVTFNSPPPSETVTFIDIPKEVYEDLRAAKCGDKQVTMTYGSEPPHTIKSVKIL